MLVLAAIAEQHSLYSPNEGKWKSAENENELGG